MIIPTYSQFRTHFAERITESSVSCTFADAGPDTIGRASGSFVTQGYQAGMTVEPYGTTSNDAVYTIASVAATVLTLVSTDAVAAEGPVSCALKAYWTATDGWPEYPGPQTRGTNLVVPNGFGYGNSLSIVTGEGLNGIVVTMNDSAADAVQGVDEYDWWLSDRTEDDASRWLSVAQIADDGGQSFSGTVGLEATALALSELRIVGDITMAQWVSLFKNAYIYVRVRATGAIHWTDLQHRLSFLAFNTEDPV